MLYAATWGKRDWGLVIPSSEGIPAGQEFQREARWEASGQWESVPGHPHVAPGRIRMTRTKATAGARSQTPAHRPYRKWCSCRPSWNRCHGRSCWAQWSAAAPCWTACATPGCPSWHRWQRAQRCHCKEATERIRDAAIRDAQCFSGAGLTLKWPSRGWREGCL